MKIINRLFAAAAVVAGIATAGVASAEPEVTLRVHGYLPAPAPLMKDFFTPWSEKIMKESDGRIKIEIYPSMTLGGSPASLFDQAKDGFVDIVSVPLLYTPNRFPISTVFELPFVTGKAEPTSKAAWEFYEKHMRDELNEVHVLSLYTHGPGILHKRGGEPIQKLEDLKSLKIRGPNRPVNDFLAQQGAIPVSIPGAGISEALSKGVIDVGTYPWEAVPALKIHELVDSHTQFAGERPLYVALFVIAMNKQKYESLPPDLKKVMDANSGMTMSTWVGQVMDESDKAGIEVVRKHGNKIITIDESETDRWKDASKPVIEKWLEDMKRRGIDGAVLLEDFKASLEKHETAAR